MKNIVLGLGNNIDYEIKWDSAVFERLIAEYQISDAELSGTKGIACERDLVISILSFLKNENGGECFVDSPQTLLDFSSHFVKKITLGGTSVRAGIAMRKLGFLCALHLVTINDDMRKLLPADCEAICSADAENSYPHVIIQFTKDTLIDQGDIHIRTKRANRIIYDNDFENIIMKLSDQLGELIAGARVFLISGFNAMQSAELLRSRLETLIQAMARLPKDALVFYEDACFYDPTFSGIVREKLLPFIDVYSLNEDEFQAYLGRKVDLLNAPQMLTALDELHTMIPAPILVVHTAHWALAYGSRSDAYAEALKGGITMAGTRFRFGDDFTVAEYKHTEAFKLQSSGAQFASEINAASHGMVCCLACIDAEESKATTIGLGDAFVGGFIPALTKIHR